MHPLRLIYRITACLYMNNREPTLSLLKEEMSRKGFQDEQQKHKEIEVLDWFEEEEDTK